MDVTRRRADVRTSVVAGSVWESRMKLDQVQGGIKVFNGEANIIEDDNATITSDNSAKSLKKTPIAKRKTWKSESFDGPIQIAPGLTDSSVQSCEDKCRELSVSVDGGINKKSLLLSARKGRSGVNNNGDFAVSVSGTHKSPVHGKKGRSEAADEKEKIPLQMRKRRSDVKEVVNTSAAEFMKIKSDFVYCGSNQSVVNNDTAGVDSGFEKDSSMLKISRAETDRRLSDESVIKDSSSSSDDSFSGIERKPPEIEENGSEESCKEFRVCQEQVICSSESNEIYPRIMVRDTQDDDEFGEERSEEEEMEIETEIVEKKNVHIVEVKIPEEKPKKKEAPPTPQQKFNNKKIEFTTPEEKPKKVITKEENRRVYQFGNRAPPSTTSTVSPPVLSRAAIYDNVSKPTSIGNGYQKNFSERHNKLQSIVDLVMWRDISRSAFVFGIGTFTIISSSYARDVNISFISVISYLGLVYLALIFLYRSLIYRGAIDIDDTRYPVGEEEAIWLVKLVLPYVNECLLKIRALFVGDPATTMKMAVLLFIFARCGNSITIWKMAKLGFFGAFTVPKVCSSYSTQLTAYAKFWMKRVRDSWDSCSHKKAVALAIFTLFWNLSSMVARIWAVFMMYVAVRYYQQWVELNEGEDWVVEDDGDDENEAVGSATASASVQVNKLKKLS